MVKWVDSKQVEHVAVLLEAQLEKGDWLALDEAFAVKTENWWRVAHPNLATQTFD